MVTMTAAARPRLWALVLIGLAAGLLSGAFGVGGGIIVTPVLMLLGMDQRRAAGTSLAALLPTSAVGAVGYALGGSIDWIVALLLAAGTVVGAQIGSALLDQLPSRGLFWAFVCFLVLTNVSLWLATPERDASVDMSWGVGIGLAAAGIVVGMLSALFGIGGGIVIVPALVVGFGTSDLVAKGSSLAAIVPGAVSGTIANASRRNVDLVAAATVGAAACVGSPIGVLVAFAMTPLLSTITFSALLAAITIQLVARRLRGRGGRAQG